jgi:hypothetical protein
MNSEECRGKIQSDLDNAYEWTQEWLLKFNIDKCLVMHYMVLTIKSIRFT